MAVGELFTLVDDEEEEDDDDDLWECLPKNVNIVRTAQPIPLLSLDLLLLKFHEILLGTPLLLKPPSISV